MFISFGKYFQIITKMFRNTCLALMIDIRMLVHMIQLRNMLLITS